MGHISSFSYVPQILSHNSLRMISWVRFMFLMFSHPAFDIFYQTDLLSSFRVSCLSCFVFLTFPKHIINLRLYLRFFLFL